ncbi:7656_t:CDS:1, partial [Dentiscutata heterogama]
PNIQLNEYKNRQNINSFSEITPSSPLYIPDELAALNKFYVQSNEINEGPSNKLKNKNQQNINSFSEITPSSPIYFPDKFIDIRQ